MAGMPGGYLSDQSCNGAFVKDGYTVSVSTSPATNRDAAGLVDIRLMSLGNVYITKLPAPGGRETSLLLPHGYGVCHREVREGDIRGPYHVADGQRMAALRQGGRFLVLQENAVRLLAWPSVAPARGAKP